MFAPKYYCMELPVYILQRHHYTIRPGIAGGLALSFNSDSYNPNGAQLIFTSHNTNLLDLAVFRRNRIWFTEKDEVYAATELFSLCDFSVRKDVKIEKGYLLGRYGAIPLIKEGFL